MRMFLIICGVIALASITGFGALGQRAALFPTVSTETVQLTAVIRARLRSLKAEHKFQPNNYPPLGYVGVETSEEEKLAVAAVDRVIDNILGQHNAPIAAEKVSALIGEGMQQVDQLATEDRDRTAGYMIEIWYILGFKGATGRFAYGSAYPRPSGYGEPLPPGWTSPDHPRRIG
ncbi:MAG: DUF4844 domain-containing protein [Sphingomonas sp.]|jgi:hypothetical protein|uniref:DUF4844 domain-containing protein n=1 Tax=Sphingomonas sp. TaxID=28214 RepID=UPI0035679654